MVQYNIVKFKIIFFLFKSHGSLRKGIQTKPFTMEMVLNLTGLDFQRITTTEIINNGKSIIQRRRVKEEGRLIF